jgi:hypothetical protein
MCLRGGALLNYFRPLLLILTVAIFSAATWADGIDPRTIIVKGSGSTPITLTNPNPSIGGPNGATPTVGSSNGFSCINPTDACYYQVYQNQTGVTLSSLNIALNDLTGFTFSCAITPQSIDFTNCSSSDNGSVTDIYFSGGTGVAPATQQCVPDTAIDKIAQAMGAFNCTQQSSWNPLNLYDPDDYKFVGGEFAVLIDATANEGNFAAQKVTGSVVTTPEPGEGIMLLFGALAFGLFKLVRRAA